MSQNIPPEFYIMKFFNTFSVAVILLSSLCSAQLSGSVGPTTSTASKTAKKVCNVLNYGAVADKSTDLGPPLASAFAACKSGGVGEYPSISKPKEYSNISKSTYLLAIMPWQPGKH